MKKLRAALVLLLCLCLPGWAVASQWRDLGCPHHGIGAQQHGHHHAACKDGGEATQCQCAHYCANGGASLAAGNGFIGTWLVPAAAFTAEDYAGLTARAHSTFPFRPPIAAPAGAA